MKIAAVEWLPGELETVNQYDLCIKIEEDMKKADSNGAKMIIFPGFTGVYHQQLALSQDITKMVRESDPSEYLNFFRELSLRYSLVICPGSYWRADTFGVYHQSCLVWHGQICLEQTQLYLSQWEKGLGFARGKDQNLLAIDGWKVGLLLTTDLYYPQVARSLALMGADLIIAPTGFVGQRNPWVLLSGMWKDVQQNQVFAVESGFNGSLAGKDLWGETIIHGPVEMTENQDGFIARTNNTTGLIIAELNNIERQKIISKYDFLGQLNPEFYRRMQMFGGKI